MIAMKTLSQMGEQATIRSLMKFLQAGDDIVVGAGDDCAVVRPAGNLPFDILLTSDPVIEGTHFTETDSPWKVGHKAVGRVLSDIAAMGGTPDWALINLVAPLRTPVSRVEEAYKGASRNALKYRMKIIGGDLSRGPVFEMHVFAVGRVPRGAAVLRSGAKPGDIIFVTGSLGYSRKSKHLLFAPRLQEGIWLRKSGMVTSMTDISDGLACDIRNIAEMSKTGARLEADSIPVSEQTASGRSTALNHALYDGEDFELLFTVPASKRDFFIRRWTTIFKLRCTPVGVITPHRGRIECRMPNGRITAVNKRGFAHFE